MGAISACLLSILAHGDRIVASDRLYGRTAQLLNNELSRYGIQTTYADVTDLEEVRKTLLTRPRILFVETISNPLLRLPDLKALATLAHGCGCLLIVDNTFATPVLCRPLELGADVVVESLTKMIGGHSDLTLGIACGGVDIRKRLTTVISTWGMMANPFDCWLGCRSLATMALRVRAASANAASLADWLADQPGIMNVVYPGKPDHPDFEIARRQLLGGFGNMLCMELDGGQEAVSRFFRRSPRVSFSPSLGHTTTTLSHPSSTSHRYVDPGDKARQGIRAGLIRLSVGIEELAHIRTEIGKGLD
jgi:cystathionine beta-lyase/cystathionine gamma-synthase